MAVIRVLKPFMFTFTPTRDQRTPTEQLFVRRGVNPPWDIEIPDDHPLLSHSWYLETFCDGKVESPAQARARLDLELQKIKDQERDNAVSKAASEAAVARLNNTGLGIKGTNEELQAELNTPIPELKAKQDAKRAAGVTAAGGVK